MQLKTLFPALCMFGLAGAASTASAYDFDESCAPTTVHNSSKSAPSALLMLDNSCSMDNDSGNGQTKMTVARSVITELTNAITKTGTCSTTDKSGCDDVLMGVGWFSISAGVDVPLLAEDAQHDPTPYSASEAIRQATMLAGESSTSNEEGRARSAPRKQAPTEQGASHVNLLDFVPIQELRPDLIDASTTAKPSGRGEGGAP